MKKQAKIALTMAAVGIVLGGGAFALETWTRGGPSSRLKRGQAEVERRTNDRSARPPWQAPPGMADNPGIRSVREAEETSGYPERLTPFVASRPFDRAAFEADPEAYLSVVEPGRCFQTEKEPTLDSVHLRALSSLTPSSDEDGLVALSVETAPAAPVTFTSFGPGYFRENTLNSVSLRADAGGRAVAHYVVAKGASATVPVLVGSPEAVGNQTFLIMSGPPPLASNRSSRD
jgi:hypothetical protein